jgi:hypothetical protein
VERPSGFFAELVSLHEKDGPCWNNDEMTNFRGKLL